MNIAPVKETRVGIAPTTALLTAQDATRALAASATTTTVTAVGGVRATTASIEGATVVTQMKLTAAKVEVIAPLAVSVSGTVTTAPTASTNAVRPARIAVTANDVTDSKLFFALNTCLSIVAPIRRTRIAITRTTLAPDVATTTGDATTTGEAKSPLKMCTLISRSGLRSMCSPTSTSMATSSSGTAFNGSAKLSAS